MAPHAVSAKRRSGLERVRARILTALHVGRLSPGDRVPSVRRLADLTGMNPKTIHRAYTTLAREGLLEARPCGGTYVGEGAMGSSDLPAANKLGGAVNRLRAEASRLGLPPASLARALTAFFDDGLSDLPVAVTECNGEQLGLIERDLAASLGVMPRPVPLARLKADPVRTLDGVRHLVTTNCHLGEVAGAVATLDIAVHAVSLDAEFPTRIAHLASRAHGVMVVSDKTFEPVFLRLLRQISVPEKDLDRIAFASPAEVPRVLRTLGGDPWLHVSPLVERQMESRSIGGLHRVQGAWRVRDEALERLRARLSVEVATGDGSDAVGQVRQAGWPGLPTRRFLST